MEESPSSQPRVKRQKIDRNGRMAALSKLRELKGQKNKLNVQEEVDNVYDIIDEKEFSKRSKDIYGLDWIEDDGTGYLEDGRDFFEDEEDYSDDNGGMGTASKKNKTKNSRKRLRDSDKPTTKKGTLKNLFSNAVPKKKPETNVKVAEDGILAGILDEMVIGKDEKTNETDQKFDTSQAREYMKNFRNNLKKETETLKRTSAAVKKENDDEMINRILKTKKTNREHYTGDDVPRPIKEEPKEIKKETVSLRAEEKPAVVTVVKSAIISKPPDFSEDIDLSCLDDDSNQFAEVAAAEMKIDSKPLKETIDSVTVSAEKEKQMEKFESLSTNWQAHFEGVDFDEEIPDVSGGMDDPELSSENLKFWLWDAWEDSLKRPGQVFLFGKIQTGENNYKSCCIHIQNVERIMWILPRKYALDPITKEPTDQQVSFQDVHSEFMEIMIDELGVTDVRVRKVTKLFAFKVPEVDVPEMCEVMEVRYDGKKPAPDMKKKRKTFSYIFGTNTQSLETFLIDRKIKGPTWLNINNFSVKDYPLTLTWCKVEINCPEMKCICVADEQNNNAPPLTLLTLNVRTVVHPSLGFNQVVMISGLVNTKFPVNKRPPTPPFQRYFCAFTNPAAQKFPVDLFQALKKQKESWVKLDTEKGLLSWFLTTYEGIDPDIIVTHDASGCQLDALSDRLVANRNPLWSKIGRLKLTNINGKRIHEIYVGRLICDVKTSAEELIKAKNYDLDTLCQSILKMNDGNRMDFTMEEICKMFSKSDELLKLITLTMQDTFYILRIMCELDVLPLSLQITKICGNLMRRTLLGGRSERNEYLLLHAFTEKNYIVPEKKVKEFDKNKTTQAVTTGQSAGARKKPQYAGGLVLEPVKGFYDKFILLMDFNSLYPSIIQEYNICYTTIPEPEGENSEPMLPDASVEQGVLPRQIRRLVESRREVKKLMAVSDLDPDLRKQYDIRQKALKLTANSMYGCLGFGFSRFHAQHLAALITQKGREILTNTKALVQKLNFEVIYGDTDSIMINTNSTDYDQVHKIGYTIKQSVNKIYKQIELDVESVFKYLLLLKKKKYASLVITKNARGEFQCKQEIKGLDIVRRDWSQIAIMAGKNVVDEILSDSPLDTKLDNIHAHLEKFRNDLMSGCVPVPLLTIIKQLIKDPKDYAVTNTLSHVVVARRMNATRNKRYKRGDMVSYIICEDGTDNSAMQRAYHIEELKSRPELKVDTFYYLAQQIHPIVERLCGPLEGTDASRIAEYLGLDPSKYKHSVQTQRNTNYDADYTESLTKSCLKQYDQCEQFKFSCMECKTENFVATPFKIVEGVRVPSLTRCLNKECNLSFVQYASMLRNHLIQTVRRHIRRFYENWMVCDEPSCNHNTRLLPHVTDKQRPICLACKKGVLVRQYSEFDLFLQLSFYQHIFDVTKIGNKNGIAHEIEPAYNLLKETIDNILEKSEFCTVSLAKIFSRLRPT